jgi:hypothetical protein
MNVGCMDSMQNKLVIKVILIVLFILIIFMAFIIFGLSDVCAGYSAKDRDWIIPVVMSLESEWALEIGVKPCITTPVNLKNSNNNGTITNSVMIKDYSDIELEVVEHKYFAPGVGQVAL